jgi:endonuclease G
VTVLENTGYVSGYSEKYRQPVWVAFMTSAPIKFKDYKRDAKFMPDTRVPDPVKTSDYNACGFSRGHMATAATVYAYYGEKAETEAFLLTNIIPQKQENNVSCWKTLEEKSTLSRGNWTEKYEKIYVVCGPVFSEKVDSFKGVSEPTEVYKLVVRGTKDRPSLLVFETPNVEDKEATNKTLQSYLVTLQKVEKETGIHFFPDLEKQPEAETEIWP